MMSATTAPGDLVLLIGRDRKPFVFSLQTSQVLQTHRGMIQHKELIGQPWGAVVQTHLGYDLSLLRPSTDDLVRHALKRATQIVYPKDAGYLLLKLNVKPGSRVIEAGTGSGGMAMMLAQAVMPEGRIYSYESRSDMHTLAQKNLSRLGLDRYVEFKLRNIQEGFDEENVDALFMDVPNPWDYLAQAAAALVGSGFFGCILPTTNQVSDLLHAFRSHPFSMIEVEELILRPFKAVPARLRPQDRIIAHTGFLVFARKLLPASDPS